MNLPTSSPVAATPSEEDRNFKALQRRQTAGSVMRVGDTPGGPAYYGMEVYRGQLAPEISDPVPTRSHVAAAHSDSCLLVRTQLTGREGSAGGLAGCVPKSRCAGLGGGESGAVRLSALRPRPLAGMPPRRTLPPRELGSHQ